MIQNGKIKAGQEDLKKERSIPLVEITDSICYIYYTVLIKYFLKMNKMWIEKKEKKNYKDSTLNGIRLYFHKKIKVNLKLQIKHYCKWLRNFYYFPIRVELKFLSYKNFKINSNSEKKEFAIFSYQKSWDNKEKHKKI